MCVSRAIVWVVPKAEPDLTGPLQQGRPTLLTPIQAACPGHTTGLEMMQWCRRGSGARVMLGARTWRTGGRCYRHEWF